VLGDRDITRRAARDARRAAEMQMVSKIRTRR